ncbi:MAG TPA: hypothetical protein VLO09_01100, partial [Ornithinimicrobium sp.]|nr:hypothetical protein [Ornithinimicrobium sp.]
MPHSPPRWGWLLDRDGSTTWVVERPGDRAGPPAGAGTVVATGRPTQPEEEVVLAELAAVDGDAARAMVAHAHALARSVDETSPVTVWDRPRTVAGAVVSQVCGEAPAQAEQSYVRVPDAALLLDRMRPALEARLASSGLEPPEEVLLGTFRQHLRMPVVDGRFGEPVVGGPLQGPGALGGAGVAPDQLGPLLLGPLGMAGLARRHPDVYPGPHAALMEALFPPVTADLLTYYLP